MAQRTYRTAHYTPHESYFCGQGLCQDLVTAAAMERRWLLFPSGCIMSSERHTGLLKETCHTAHTAPWEHRTLYVAVVSNINHPGIPFFFECLILEFSFSFTVTEHRDYPFNKNYSNSEASHHVREGAAELNSLSAAVHWNSCEKSTQKWSDLFRGPISLSNKMLQMEGNLCGTSE